MSAIALLPIFSRGPVPRSSLYKYICCKKYGCATGEGNLARTHGEQGRLEDAEPLEVMEKERQVLGDGHPNTLMTMSNLAIT